MQENILTKQLNLGLNFSTPSEGVTSPLLKESMTTIHNVDPLSKGLVTPPLGVLLLFITWTP